MELDPPGPRRRDGDDVDVDETWCPATPSTTRWVGHRPEGLQLDLDYPADAVPFRQW
jgi:hypothetical protein